MDSLIVLRKPLRKSHLVPKFITPKKAKKAVPKVDPIPPDPYLGEESNCEPPISFVKLYKELVVNSGRARAASQLVPPPRLHVNTPATRSDASRSDTSLVTQYRGPHRGHFAADITTCNRVIVNTPPPPPSTARADVIFQLDHGTSFEDSGFS